MKSALQAYKDLAEKEMPKKEINYLFLEIDHKIAAYLGEEGYSTDQIERAILHESPAVKNKSTEEIDRYLRHQVPRNLPENGVAIPVKVSYREKKEKFYSRFVDLFLKKDLHIFCKLLDDGYSLKEVMEAEHKCSLLSSQFDDKKVLSNYVDKVLAFVNPERILHTGKLYDLAKKVYLEKTLSIGDKYTSYSKSNYNAFHEGSIVISMMLQHNFSPEVIEEVLRRNSVYPQLNDQYIKDIMDKCQMIKEFYTDIKNTISPREVRTEEDAYRFFAREYMERTNTEILSGRDEQCIIARMYAEKFPREYVLKALAKASPVAIEPGRDKNRYISTVMTLVENKYENKKIFAMKQYPVTVNMYDEKIERLSQRLKEKGYTFGVEKNRSYYDAIVVCELLEEKQSALNIIRVIAEKSPLAIKKNSANPDKTPEGYAKWIVHSAQKVLKAEKDLIAWENKDIPQNISYKKILETGITSLDLFKQAIHERLEAYPSLSAMLTAPFIDKDISEKLLTRYPDFNKEELYEILCQQSPRALMPGISTEYPEHVIHEVENRLEAAHKQKDYTKTVQEEYNKQCGLAAEGVNTDTNMSLYQDGRAALRMLMNHIDPMEVRNAIFESAKAAAMIEPLVYADGILSKAEAVRARMAAIKEYDPIQALPQTAEEDYKNRLSQKYREKNFLQSSMDAAIMKAMLLENKFKSSEIRQAIQENSPIAIEPGRDNKYEFFVEAQAKERIEQEKIKFRNYKPLPRIEREENAGKEYTHHRQELQKTIDLPYIPPMDALIAETMLIQGYKKDLIAEALIDSPCSDKQKKYGLAVVRNAEKSLTSDRTKEQAMVRTLIKTTEITTTTTTKTTEV